MWVSNADDACATVAVAVISRRLLAGATFRNPCRVKYDSTAHLRSRRVRRDEPRGRHRVARTDRRHEGGAVAQAEPDDET
jgi:hypothetical protein